MAKNGSIPARPPVASRAPSGGAAHCAGFIETKSSGPVEEPDDLKSLRHKIEYVSVDLLKPLDRRARTHSEDQLAMLSGAFEAFGLINPLVVDDEDRILAGFARWTVAKRLGYTEVPIVRVAHLSADEKRAYTIAENRIAERAGWDRSILAIEFKHLIEIDLGFELDITGFSFPEIDLVFAEAEAEETDDDPADDVPDIEGSAVSQAGDLWLLGKHRVLCGDALQAQSYEVLLAGEQARMVLSDAPYNVPVDGFVSGLGKNKHREFAMASGEMSEAEFTAFLAKSMEHMKASLINGGLAYLFMDYRHLWELQSAARAAHLKLLTLCVWDKEVGALGGLYRNQHELVLVFKAGSASYVNNVELGKHGRNRTTVWRCRGMASFGPGRDEALAAHPTVKPVALLAEAIKDCSKRGEIVLDPFLGSGSTLIAAEKTGRRGFDMELDPRYVDTTVRRFEKLTGKQAVHDQTGLTLEALAEARLGEDAAGATAHCAAMHFTNEAADPRHEAAEEPLRVRIRHRSRVVVNSLETAYVQR